MPKIAMLRFFAVVAVVTCVVHVSADVQLKGPGTKRIVVNKDTFDYKMDYTKTYAFYNTTDNKQKQFYTLHVGGCKVEFMTGYCGFPQVGNRQHNTKANSTTDLYQWYYFHDDFPVGTVNSSYISFYGLDYLHRGEVVWDTYYSCNAQLDSNSVPGKYVVDVSLTGEVAPDLVVDFVGAELFTTTTSSSTVVSTTVKPPCPQCKERGIEAWLIGLIVAIIVLALLVIGLCVGIFCCYRCMQKAKAQKIVQSEHPTVKSTVSTAPGPLVKETNLYGPDMMYFGRDPTPADPNAKTEATNLATQISPALNTSQMPTPQ